MHIVVGGDFVHQPKGLEAYFLKKFKGDFVKGGFYPEGILSGGDFVQRDFVKGDFVMGDFVLQSGNCTVCMVEILAPKLESAGHQVGSWFCCNFLLPPYLPVL